MPWGASGSIPLFFAVLAFLDNVAKKPPADLFEPADAIERSDDEGEKPAFVTAVACRAPTMPGNGNIGGPVGGDRSVSSCGVKSCATYESGRTGKVASDAMDP